MPALSPAELERISWIELSNSTAAQRTTLVDPTTGVPVSPAPAVVASPTFMVTTTNFAPVASATDIMVLYGSATKAVYPQRLRLQCNQTTGGIVVFNLYKRITVNTGGTPVAMTPIPADHNDFGAVTASVLAYTANATGLGGTQGIFRTVRLWVPAMTAEVPIVEVNLAAPPGGKPFVLRGVIQSLCINLGGVTVTGGLFDISLDWTEV